ncbi:serine/threonine-protein kinase [Streptomyces sp. NPDC002920]
MSTWAVPGYSESFELGSGASGRVVLAVHEPTGVPVAVKYLSESLLTRPGFVHGFRAEAERLGGLESPYVTGFYEYVEAPEGAAIVMELVDGVSLRTLLARQSPLSPESALTVLKGSLLGLADAHRAGVVHRDYKPANVLVTPEGVSKLVDFGIAVDAGVSTGVAGTPAYMAPEQWTGAPASPAGDVYAATATFFECLTGRKPFPGDNLAQLALQHAHDPVPVEEVPEEVPEAVRDLVRRGLAKSADQRPADAAAFVADLERAAVATYGEDWEERGRGRLAALVALLLFLLPSGRSSEPGTTTDTARTVLARAPGAGRLHAWRPTWPGAAVAAAAVLVALLLGQGIGQGAGAGGGTQTLATTSPEPVAETGPLPSPTAPPTPSVTADSPVPEASSGAASPPATDGDPAPSPSAGTSTSPPPPSGSPSPSDSSGTTTSPSPSPSPVAVKEVTVTGFRQTGTATATATITVTTDGTGPVSVSVGWFTNNAAGAAAGTADGAVDSYARSGATQYTITVEHTFQGSGCYWIVQASTSPAAASGGASQQLLTRQCTLR